MPEQIQAIINRILEWWRKFTKRQQVLIVSITAVVLVSFIILALVITRPNYVELIKCEDILIYIINLIIFILFFL